MFERLTAFFELYSAFVLRFDIDKNKKKVMIILNMTDMRARLPVPFYWVTLTGSKTSTISFI